MKLFAVVIIGLALAAPAYNALGNYLQTATQGQASLPVVTADVQLYLSIAALAAFLLLLVMR